MTEHLGNSPRSHRVHDPSRPEDPFSPKHRVREVVPLNGVEKDFIDPLSKVLIRHPILADASLLRDFRLELFSLFAPQPRMYK